MSSFYYIDQVLYVDCGYGDYSIDVSTIASFDISSLPEQGGFIIEDLVWYADGILQFQDNDGGSIDVSYQDFIREYC